MRKSRIVTIEDLGEVLVKEVSPFAVYKAMSADSKVAELKALVADCITLPDGKGPIEALYPSEIEQLIDAFLEVNSSFLAIAGKLAIKNTLIDLGKELPELMRPMLAEVSKLLPPIFADSYKMVMAKMPGIMAGAALSSPSKP
ncbi:MAG: hypothetical protein KJ630_01180 [Proteobacteria bacterium]|nr:hypothetical protein [Pseudomonadota bacterium]